MRPSPVFAALLTLPLLSCSVEVDQPATKPGTNRYEIIVRDTTTDIYMFDTYTGALYDRDNRRWRKIVVAPEE